MGRFYTPGKKPQYGAERWKRYENLRVKGFLKGEARLLSAMKSPHDLGIVESMIKTRQRLVKQADKGGWSIYEYRHAVRDFYNRNKLTSIGTGRFTRRSADTSRPIEVRKHDRRKSGKPDPGVWFNRQENLTAKKKGWRKGDTDGEGESIVPRRPKKKTPERYKDRGAVAQQKARARARKKLIEASESTGKLRIDILEREVDNSPGIIAKTTDPILKHNMIRRQIELRRRLYAARQKGAKYG